MNRLLKALPTICIALGLLSLGVGAAWRYLTPTAPPAAIDRPVRELSGVEVGREVPVEFAIHNPTGHPVRVLGLAPC